MRRWLAVGCGIVSMAIAGSALAQRSLFDTPPAGGGIPAPTAPAPAPAQQEPAAAPAAAPKAKARPKKPKGPVPARALTINNASTNTLTGLEVSAEGKSVKLKKALKAKAKTTLKLPAFKTCTVSIVANFEGAAQPETSELDICKDKTIRFTE